MKIWHTPTQEKYDELIKKLENEDCFFLMSDVTPVNDVNHWSKYKEDTYIIKKGKNLQFCRPSVVNEWPQNTVKVIEL